MKDKKIKLLIITIIISICIAFSIIQYKNNTKSEKVSTFDNGSNCAFNNDVQTCLEGFDKVRVYYENSAISGIYIGTTDNYNQAKWYSTEVGKANYLSLKNGIYYMWAVFNNNGGIKPLYKIKMSSSCSNEKALSQKTSGTVERCFIKTGNNVSMEVNETYLTCAQGYNLTSSIKTDNCKDVNTNYFYGNKRYCKKAYTYSCELNQSGGNQQTQTNPTNPTTPSNPTNPSGSGNQSNTNNTSAPGLKSLTVNQGSLSPTFKTSVKSYNVIVGGTVSSITVNATLKSGSSFISGYGPRSVDLQYGKNVITIKVKNNKNKKATYTITVTRQDDRNNNNLLNDLSITDIELYPKFEPEILTYDATVGEDIDEIAVNASIADSKSSFVEGFAPRKVKLEKGYNQVQIKVISESEETKVYTINVAKGVYSCAIDKDKIGQLKEIIIESDDANIPKLELEEGKTVYDLKVPYNVSALNIKAYVQDDEDKVEIEGGNNLEPHVNNVVTIKVISSKCEGMITVYTINVNLSELDDNSSNAELKNITIKNHPEFKFEPNVEKYSISLKKGETKLLITLAKTSPNTNCGVEGNEDLKVGSNIVISCLSEDKTSEAKYTITVRKVEKGMNVFLFILIIIVIIGIIVILVLRLLGYKIYFNFEAVTSFFQGIGEKIHNFFDR